MADITKIKLPNQSQPYNIKDAGAVRFDNKISLTNSQKKISARKY